MSHCTASRSRERRHPDHAPGRRGDSGGPGEGHLRCSIGRRGQVAVVLAAGLLLGAAESEARGGPVAGNASAGRPYATWTTLSTEAGAPRAGRPAVAVTESYFRLAPAAAGSVLELRLPGDRTSVMRAFGGGRELRTKVRGRRLLVEPPGDVKLALRTKTSSGPGGPLRREAGRIVIGDLAATVQRGGRTVPPPPHFRTGVSGPDVGQHVLHFDQRGWEVTRANMKRDAPDYVHPYSESIQTHFSGRRARPFTATATYTGRVKGKPAEGLRATMRRGGRRLLSGIGMTVLHATEGLRAGAARPRLFRAGSTSRTPRGRPRR